MTFSDALPVLSTKNDGHCHHSRMGVFPDYYLKIIGWPARLALKGARSRSAITYGGVASSRIRPLTWEFSKSKVVPKK